MKRDMDLLRNLLFQIEDKDVGLFNDILVEAPGIDQPILQGHLRLLTEAKLIDAITAPDCGDNFDYYTPIRLTWAGHDFLDSVRDPEIWSKTKEGAESAGGFTLELLAALAKGFLKLKIKQHTGVELEF